MKKEHSYCGKCLFCCSICPECKSTNVRVKLRLSLEYENDTEDMIVINNTGDDIELECLDCGEWFESTDLKYDERLAKLWRAFCEAIDSSDLVEVKFKSGKISYSKKKSQSLDEKGGATWLV